MKEFNLSEERKLIFKLLINNSGVFGLDVCNTIIGLIKEQDKEFIQLLKEKGFKFGTNEIYKEVNIDNVNDFIVINIKEIDKLAGAKLK